jgi:HemY protein
VRGLFWIFAIFGLAVILTLAGKNDESYVVLVYPPYRIELAFNLMIAILLGAFIAGYALVRLATHTLRLPAYVKAFRLERHRKKGQRALNDGMLAYFEGRYGKAEKFADKAMDLGESPVISASLAARAAHEQRAYGRRDEYLAHAERLAPDYPVARLMTQAELLIEQRRYQEALGILKQLHELAPKHVTVQKLELKAQQQAKNWDQVLGLVAQLEKRGAIDDTQAELLVLNAHLENLKRKALDADALKEYWLKVPSEYRTNGKIALTAARYFIGLGGCQVAIEIIEKSLERNWDSDLVRLYGQCLGKDVLKQIERAEKWLQTHPRDAALLLTLGSLCTRQELWGKAQSYLEASLAVEPSGEAHIALAHLLEKMNRLDDACKHYRKSLELTLGAVSR